MHLAYWENHKRKDKTKEQEKRENRKKNKKIKTREKKRVIETEKICLQKYTCIIFIQT